MHRSTEKKFLKAYDTWADAIFRHCYFRVYDREHAKDLMQETFMKTWEYIERGNNIENPKAFLYRVANNLIVDSSRRKKTSSLDTLQDEGFQPAHDLRESLQGQIDGKDALKIITSLNTNYRDVIVMRYVDGLGPKEIAEVLGETENVISVRLHRGLKTLKAKLENNEKK